VQDPRRDRRHGAAPQSQDHRQRRLAVQADAPHHAVRKHGKPRQVTAVLEQAEGDEERTDDREHDREGIGQAHGNHAVGTGKEVPHDPLRQQGLQRRNQEHAEDDLFEQAHQRLSAGISYEFIDQDHDRKQDPHAGGRPPCENPQLVDKAPAARDQHGQGNDDRRDEHREMNQDVDYAETARAGTSPAEKEGVNHRTRP